MKKREVSRIYRIADANLSQLADKIISNVTADLADFSSRGMSRAKIAALQALNQHFQSLQTDHEISGLKEIKTEDKNNLRARLEIATRTIFVMAANAFGDKSARFKMFGDGNISRVSDEQLIRNVRNIASVAQRFATELADEGLTSQQIADLINLNDQFDQALDAMNEAVRVRDLATEERIEAGNRLYAELVKVCNTGKDLYYTSNEAKYNDYVLSED